MRKTFKTMTVLTAIFLGLSVLGATAPSYAVTGGGNGSLASRPFPPDGVVTLGFGALAPAESYSAYYPSNAGHPANSAPTQLDWGQIDYNSNSHSMGTH
jgi:hypothetical protein